jgi:hypothetical protein
MNILDYSHLITTEGIAFDIDDSLADTITLWFNELTDLFGRPEDIGLEAFIEKYHSCQAPSYWQTKKALQWMTNFSASNADQRRIPVIDGALEHILKIQEIIPISAYITTRPESVYEGTKDWLDGHGFPKAPVILRPSDVGFSNSSMWKAHVLKQLFPQIKGIVDDNYGMISYLGVNNGTGSNVYHGDVFVYNKSKEQFDRLGIETDVKVHPCKTMKDVYAMIQHILV